MAFAVLAVLAVFAVDHGDSDSDSDSESDNDLQRWSNNDKTEKDGVGCSTTEPMSLLHATLCTNAEACTPARPVARPLRWCGLKQCEAS